MATVMPRVSVVMPAYNCAAYIGRAIDSILGQSHADLELIVGDDGSTDQTRAIIDSRKDDRIKRFHHDLNQGQVSTRNRLFDQCAGRYILFQDGDDFSSLKRIELLLKHLQDHQLDACGSAVSRISHAGDKVLKTVQFPASHEQIERSYARQLSGVCCGSLLFRKEILEKTGGYRDFFSTRCNEDEDWVLRALEHSRFGNVAEVLYFYRANRNSTTADLSPEQVVGLELAIHLRLQRLETGSDDLIAGREQQLLEYEQQLLKKYQQSDRFFLQKHAISNALGLYNQPKARRLLRQLCVTPGFLPGNLFYVLAVCLRMAMGESLFGIYASAKHKRRQALWEPPGQ